MRRMKTGLIAGACAALALLVMALGAARAQDNDTETPQARADSSISIQTDRVKTEGLHHYASPAEQAHDAMLITAVEAALRHDDIAGDHPVEVDCDHGTVRLSGIVDSPAAAKQAAQVAANVQGVVAVRNQLIWR